MAYTTTPLPSAVRGEGDLLNGLVASFSTHESTVSTLQFLNTALNTAIGLLITVTVVVFFVYLVCWYVSGRDTDQEKQAVRGAMRTFIALFLMINIWSVMTLLNTMVAMSDITAWVGFCTAFFLLGFWSLFGAGEPLVRLFAHTLNTGLDATTSLLSRHVKRFKRLSPDTARLFALLFVGALITIVGFFATDNPSPAEQGGAPPRKAITYSNPLVYEKGDASLENNHYVNKRYGIEITYPDGWTVSEATTNGSLVYAYDKEHGIYSFLNAGTYADLAAGSRQEYLTALWRVEKNIHLNFASSSVGILSSETTPYADVGGSTSTLLRFASFWNLTDGTIGPVIDSYVMFGTGPVYFTLQLGTANAQLGFDVLNDTSAEIVNSIRVLPARL